MLDSETDDPTWVRVEEGDPNRCQAMDATGQCRYRRCDPSNYCLRHSGYSAKAAEQKKNQRMYRLQRYQNRLDELFGSEQIKTVREEIGIMRILLEEILNKCKSADDMILWSDKITAAVGMIERLVMSCQKLEEKSGALLDQGALLNLADGLTTIIGDYVEDPDALKHIGERFLEQVATIVRRANECRPV